MRLIDENLLTEFRERSRCENCGRWLREPAHPHHVYGRGFGGGTRMDIRINLCAVCGPHFGGVGCHALVHAGKIPRSRLLAIVARREGWDVEALEAELFRLLRTSRKDA